MDYHEGPLIKHKILHEAGARGGDVHGDEGGRVEVGVVGGETGGEDGGWGEVLDTGAPVAGGQILAVLVSVETLTGGESLARRAVRSCKT